MLTPDCTALWIWRKEKFRMDGQKGVNCAVFRNEGTALSSCLIQAADEIGWDRWPGERHFTFVDPTKVRSTNPGYCFKRAGWPQCGRTAKGLLILERLSPCKVSLPNQVAAISSF